MTALARYDAMLAAIADVKSIDEAKDIADKAEAMRAYARQAKNRDAEIDMAEIRIRAERRLGEMIDKEQEAGRIREGGTSTSSTSPERLLLKQAGIDNRLSMRSQELAGIPREKFSEDMASWRARMETTTDRITAKLIHDETKREQRDLREIELAGRQLADPDERFGVVYADFAWRFEVYSRETGLDRAADNHYPTEDLEKIRLFPINDFAADDCVFFCWSTVPFLHHALRTLSLWGFEYKSHIAWVKDRIGTGYWVRNKHEILLIATRGKVPAPAPGTQCESVIEAPVGRHSAKPEVFAEEIERLFPNLPKIELFRRGKARPGWKAWGNESFDDDSAEAAHAAYSAAAETGAADDQPILDDTGTARARANGGAERDPDESRADLRNGSGTAGEAQATAEEGGEAREQSPMADAEGGSTGPAGDAEGARTGE